MFSNAHFDAGNQFAGAGFMPTQAPETGYGGGGGSGGAKKSASSTLRALTIRQLAKEVNPDNDMHMVDGVEVVTFSVVGKVVGVQDKGNHLSLTLSDGTGELEAAYWLQEDSEYALQNRRAELQPGTYVKAVGNLRLTQDKRLGLNAYSLRVITNFNEVTYHFLRTIFEHLYFTKGAAGAAQAGAVAAAGGFGAPAGGGWGGAPQQHQQQPAAGGGAAAFAGAGPIGDPCQDAVFQFVKADPSESGVHTQDIYNHLINRFSRQQVDQALQSLINEAHVYTTTDDHHWKAT